MGKDGGKRRVVWGITGSGDRLPRTVKVMEKIITDYRTRVALKVYLSKAGYQVVQYYRLKNELEEYFGRIHVEIDSNTPFLAGALQSGRYEFLLIAPATSNTVAKISSGIADSLLSNAAIMALKAFVPVYIMPSDCAEGCIVTKLPDGRDMRLRIRKEDVEHVNKLESMDDVFILRNPDEIYHVFETCFQ